MHPSAICALTRDSLGYTWIRERWQAVTQTQDDYETLWREIKRMQREYDVPNHKVRVDPML